MIDFRRFDPTTLCIALTAGAMYLIYCVDNPVAKYVTEEKGAL